MNNIKEYYEILNKLKFLINSKDFNLNEECFNKDFLKSLILNDSFSSELNILKDKHKFQLEKNKNTFQLIKNLGKKQQKENKIILLNTASDSYLFYNEPEYIKALNKNIYEKYVDFLKEFSKDFKLISIVNGNSTEEVMKEENYNNFCSKKQLKHYPTILSEIYKIKNENLKLNINRPEMKGATNNKGVISSCFNFRMKVQDIKYLKSLYTEYVNSFSNYEDELLNSKKSREQIEICIKENKKVKLIETIKNGIPNSLRFKIYLFLMGVENNIENVKLIDDNVFLIDYLILEDVNHSTSNENYFLFEENLKTVLFQLVRDKDVISEIQGVRPTMIYSINQQKIDLAVPYPSSGLMPLKGLAYLCAPFCYISNNVSEILLIFKNFFCKYLSFLSSFTTNKNSILSLIFNFRYLFSSLEELRDLHSHLNSLNVDVVPTVFDWMTSAFADIISPNNVFLLYDMIIMSDNLSIITLFALSIMYHKRNILLSLQTKEELNNAMALIKYENLQVLECLNNFLNIL